MNETANPCLEPQALELANNLYARHPGYAQTVQHRLIAFANELGIKVYVSDALKEPVFGQFSIVKGEYRVVLAKDQAEVRKRYLVAKAIARRQLNAFEEQCVNIEAAHCQSHGEQMLENHLACAILVPKSQARTQYLRCTSIEEFAGYFGVSVLCAKIALRTHEGDRAVALMEVGPKLAKAFASALTLASRNARPRRAAKSEDSGFNFTGELVSAGLTALATSFFMGH